MVFPAVPKTSKQSITKCVHLPPPRQAPARDAILNVLLKCTDAERLVFYRALRMLAYRERLVPEEAGMYGIPEMLQAREAACPYPPRPNPPNRLSYHGGGTLFHDHEKSKHGGPRARGSVAFRSHGGRHD